MSAHAFEKIDQALFMGLLILGFCSITCVTVSSWEEGCWPHGAPRMRAVKSCPQEPAPTGAASNPAVGLNRAMGASWRGGGCYKG